MSRAAQTVIDRDPQNLPVPLGGMAPVRLAVHAGGVGCVPAHG